MKYPIVEGPLISVSSSSKYNDCCAYCYAIPPSRVSPRDHQTGSNVQKIVILGLTIVQCRNDFLHTSAKTSKVSNFGQHFQPKFDTSDSKLNPILTSQREIRHNQKRTVC